MKARSAPTPSSPSRPANFWDNPNAVTVVAPPESSATIGSQLPLSFTVTNTQAVPDIFTLVASGSPGCTVNSVVPNGSVSLNPGQSQVVTVNVTANGAQGQSILGLLAVSGLDDTNSSQGSVFLDSKPVTVTSPPPASGVAGAPVTLTFSFTNIETAPDTFSLQTLSSSTDITVVTIDGSTPVVQGLSAVGPSLTLNPGQSAQVAVVVTLNGPVGETDQLSLSVASLNNFPTAAPTTSQATLTIAGSGGVVRALPHSQVPVSSNGHDTVYPVCPSTTAGVGNLLGVLDGAGPAAVGYCWDASRQAYVLLPAQPTGGIQPTTGIFVASSLGLGFDFSGVIAEPPVSITSIRAGTWSACRRWMPGTPP